MVEPILMPISGSDQVSTLPRSGAENFSPRNREIKGLTSLRGIAAFYVILLHFSATAQTHAKNVIPSLAPSGVIAVDLFFVLSGFIMAYSYIEHFRNEGLRAFPGFLGKRFSRIEPLNACLLIILSAIVAICVDFFGKSPFPKIQIDNLHSDLIYNILLLPGLGIGHNLNGPIWSVSDECVAYLIFPLLIALVFNRHLFICVLSVIFSVCALTAMASLEPNFGADPLNVGIYGDVVRCLAEFMLGLAVYRFYESTRYPRVLSSDNALSIIVFTIMAIILLRLGQLFAVMFFPFLILAIARNRGIGQRVLEHRILYFMGIISYSLYLVHDSMRPLELDVVKFLHPQPLSTIEALVFAVVGSLSVIAPAWLSYRLIEKPGRHLCRRLLARFEKTDAAWSQPL